MINKSNDINCSTCGKIFSTEYWHGGSIDHDNYTNDHNMRADVSRYSHGDDFYTMDEFFLESIALNGNFCNIKDNTYSVGLEIFNCRIMWLKKNGHDELAEYLESRRGDIKAEFNKIVHRKISDQEEKIEDIKKSFVV